MIARSELGRRLHAAAWVPVATAARADHLAAVEAALAGAPRLAPRRGGRLSRRVVFVLAASLASLLSIGAIFAAENAVPGDLLYPVKRVTESVQSLFDNDIAAQHRVDELQVLLGRDSPTDIDSHISDARGAVGQLPSDHALRNRLVDLVAVHDSADVGVPDQPVRVTDEPVTDDVKDAPTVDVRPVPDPPADVLGDVGHADRLEFLRRYRHRFEELRDRLAIFILGHTREIPQVEFFPETTEGLVEDIHQEVAPVTLAPEEADDEPLRDPPGDEAPQERDEPPPTDG